MCLSDSPKAPAAPVKAQEATMPAQAATGTDGSMSDARKALAQAGGDAGGTLLTGSSGVENSALKLQKTTLLGQ